MKKNIIPYKVNNLIIIIFSFILIIISIISFIITLYGYDIWNFFTGKVSDSGYVNITLVTTISINIKRDLINWSDGAIYYGESNATLFTSGDNNGTVLRGNWSGVGVRGLIIENTGNVNCSISIVAGKTAHQFFNSDSGTNEEYMFNVSNLEGNACRSGALSQWIEANVSSGGTLFCDSLNFKNEKDELYLDVLLTVPADSKNLGEQSDIITIIGSAST